MGDWFEQSVMPAAQVESFFALAIGVAIAGLIASFGQLVARPRASFRPPQRGSRQSTFAAVPLLVLAASFIIVRNSIRGRRIENRHFGMVMIAMIIACCWSLLSGTVVLMALTAYGMPVG